MRIRRVGIAQTALRVIVAAMVVALHFTPPAVTQVKATSTPTCTIQGTSAAETLTGTPGNDVICTGGGNDTVNAGAGNDIVIAEGGSVIVVLGPGDDTFDGSDAIDATVDGDDGNDTITGTPGEDELDGGAGDDTIIGGEGNDTLNGGDGADTLSGSAGEDTITGEAGADVIDGENGNDYLLGGADNDELIGGTGSDSIVGGDGSDNVTGNAGSDSIFGEAGNDQLAGGDGGDILYGGEGDDQLQGNSGDDALVGGQGSDFLYGGDGADNLAGSPGPDFLWGDNGDDLISGGSGSDQIFGGDGVNTCQEDLSDTTGNCTLTVNVDLQSTSVLSGSVLDENGTPIRWASISLSGGSGRGSVYTDAEGKFRLAMPKGTYVLTLDANLARYQNSNFDLSHDVELNPVVPVLRRIKVHVQDSMGNPVRNAYLYAENSFQQLCWRPDCTKLGTTTDFGGIYFPRGLWWDENGVERQWNSTSAYTDELGDAYFVTPSLGTTGFTLNISYTDASNVTFTSTVVITAVAATAVIDTSTSVLSGSVLDENGTPIRWASISLSGGSGRGSVYTDAEGKFRLAMPKGTYVLTLDANLARYQNSNFDLSHDVELNPVVPVLRRIKVHVQDSMGNPVRNAYLYAENSFQQLCWRPDCTKLGTTTDFGGIYFPRGLWWDENGVERQWNSTSAYTDELGDAYFVTPSLGTTGFTLNISYTDASNVTFRFSQKVMMRPSAPTTLNIANLQSREVSLDWSEPSFVGGSPITNYIIEVSDNGGGTWKSVPHSVSSRTNLRITGLIPATAYIVRIYALSEAGTSDGLSGSFTTLAGLPSAPQTLAATSVAATTLTLTWELPSSNGGSPITDYKIEVSSNGGSTWSAIPHTASNSRAFNVTGLMKGRAYQFRVSTITAIGKGVSTSALSVTTVGNPPPSPTTLKVTATTTTTVTLSWSQAAVVNGSAVRNYTVEYSTNSGSTWTVASKPVSTSKSVTLSGFRTKTTYRFRVKAINDVGGSGYSNTITVATR